MAFKEGYNVQYGLSYGAYPDQPCPPYYPRPFRMANPCPNIDNQGRSQHSTMDNNYDLDYFIGTPVDKRSIRRSRSSSSERRQDRRSKSPVRERDHRRNRDTDTRRRYERRSRSPQRRDERYKPDVNGTSKPDISSKEEYRHRSSHRKKSYRSDSSEDGNEWKLKEPRGKRSNPSISKERNHEIRKKSPLREQNRKRPVETENIALKKGRYEDILSDDDLSSTETIKSDGNNNRDTDSVERKVVKPEPEKGILTISVARKPCQNKPELERKDKSKENIEYKKEENRKKMEKSCLDNVSKAHIEDKQNSKMDSDERKQELDKIVSGQEVRVILKRINERKSDSETVQNKPQVLKRNESIKEAQEKRSKYSKRTDSEKDISNKQVPESSKSRSDSGNKRPETNVGDSETDKVEKTTTDISQCSNFEKFNTQSPVGSKKANNDEENELNAHKVIRTCTPEKVKQLSKTLSKMESEFQFASVLKNFCFNTSKTKQPNCTRDKCESTSNSMLNNGEGCTLPVNQEENKKLKEQCGEDVYDSKTNEGPNPGLNVRQQFTEKAHVTKTDKEKSVDANVEIIREQQISEVVNHTATKTLIKEEIEETKTKQGSSAKDRITNNEVKTQRDDLKTCTDVIKKIEFKDNNRKEKDVKTKGDCQKVKHHRNTTCDSKSSYKQYNKKIPSEKAEKIRKRRHTEPLPLRKEDETKMSKEVNNHYGNPHAIADMQPTGIENDNENIKEKTESKSSNSVSESEPDSCNDVSNVKPLFNKNKRRESHCKERPLTEDLACNLKNKAERIKVLQRTTCDNIRAKKVDNDSDSGVKCRKNTSKKGVHANLPQQPPYHKKALFKPTNVPSMEKTPNEKTDDTSVDQNIDRVKENVETKTGSSDVNVTANVQSDKSEQINLYFERPLENCDPDIYNKGVQSVPADEELDLDDIAILDIGQGASSEPHFEVGQKNCPMTNQGELNIEACHSNMTYVQSQSNECLSNVEQNDNKEASTPVVATRNENGSLNIDIPDEKFKETTKICYYDDVLIVKQNSSHIQRTKRKRYGQILSELNFDVCDESKNTTLVKERRRRKKPKLSRKGAIDDSQSDTDDELEKSPLKDFNLIKSNKDGMLSDQKKPTDKTGAASWIQKARQSVFKKPFEKSHNYNQVVVANQSSTIKDGSSSDNEDSSLSAILDCTELKRRAPRAFIKGFGLRHEKVLNDGSMITTRAHLDPKKLYRTKEASKNIGKCLRCLACSMFFTPLEFTVHSDDKETVNKLDRDKCVLIDFIRDGPSDDEERLVFNAFQGFFHKQKSSPNDVFDNAEIELRVTNTAVSKNVESGQSRQPPLTERSDHLPITSIKEPGSTGTSHSKSVVTNLPATNSQLAELTHQVRNQNIEPYVMQPVLNSLTVQLVSPPTTKCRPPEIDDFTTQGENSDEVYQAASNLLTLSNEYNSPSQVFASSSCVANNSCSSVSSLQPFIEENIAELTVPSPPICPGQSSDLQQAAVSEQTPDAPKLKSKVEEKVSAVQVKDETSPITPIWTTGVDDKLLTDTDKGTLRELMKEIGHVLGIEHKNENAQRFLVGSFLQSESARVWLTMEKRKKK